MLAVDGSKGRGRIGSSVGTVHFSQYDRQIMPFAANPGGKSDALAAGFPRLEAHCTNSCALLPEREKLVCSLLHSSMKTVPTLWNLT
jgi:hypothetical protein